MDRWTFGQTEGWTDGHTDEQTVIIPIVPRQGSGDNKAVYSLRPLYVSGLPKHMVPKGLKYKYDKTYNLIIKGEISAHILCTIF